MRSPFVIIAFFLLLGTPAWSSSADPNAVNVTNVVERTMRDTKAVGLSLAIIRDGKIVYLRGFGRRSTHGKPVDTGTRFEIGSLTKQFTAAAILQLKERGKLSIDDPLAKYVPAFPHARDITLRELLNQTSGLPDYLLTNHFLAISHSRPGSFEAIERMASGPLHFAPGSRWEYSNTNYIALGRVIEVVAHERYDDYVQAHLFSVAGMTHSTTLAQEAFIADGAVGYWRGMRGTDPLVVAPASLQSWTWSAGDIVSTAQDIARWDIALMGGRVITHADFALMTRPGKLTGGTRTDYAFHWWTDPLRGHRLLSGLGDTYGFSSCDDVFPDDHVAIVVLENMAVTPNGDSDAAAGVAARVFQDETMT
ncbi:MAG TPA: serine hydrolase domain-containing protein [Candidatus Baltobacteraceae bacterium]|jgi:CubicO group peptidase (beta-lactamase class C family)|nr:serine hydrolase domain-containing protein [Candidatus Baltobacteraceae bacterium]